MKNSWPEFYTVQYNVYGSMTCVQKETSALGVACRKIKKLSSYFVDYWQAGNSFTGGVAGTT